MTSFDDQSESKDFCIKLSMATIEGRPLSVTLARFGEPDTPLVGCSPGFLALSGLERRDVIGRNCRFLNQDVPLKLREKLRHSVRSGTPFMGVLDNRRHVGSGVFERFSNLFHLVVIPAGSRRYFLGIQANVTGLDLDLESGSRDAKRLQAMFDSVVASRIHAWIHIQEGALHALPLYMTIRLDDPSDDEQEHVEFLEGNALGGVGPAMLCPEAPDQYLVLAPKFDSPQGVCLSNGGFKWRTHLLGSACEVGGIAEVSTPPLQERAAPGQDQIEEKLLVTHLGEALAVKRADVDQRRSLPPGLESINAEPLYLTPPKGFGDFPVIGDEDAGGLKNHLKVLVHEDANAVLIARGITKLGLESADRLSAHFEAQGCPLKAVHVPCVFKKRRGGKGSDGVAKPQEKRVAGRCFIVMRSAADAAKVLAQGPEHMVDGVAVMVHPFDLEDARI
jgi:hypothetical protein